MQYGIKKTTVKKMDFLPDEEYMWINIWKMFEDLSNSNINNDLVKMLDIRLYEKNVNLVLAI